MSKKLTRLEKGYERQGSRAPPPSPPFFSFRFPPVARAMYVPNSRAGEGRGQFANCLRTPAFCMIYEALVTCMNRLFVILPLPGRSLTLSSSLSFFPSLDYPLGHHLSIIHLISQVRVSNWPLSSSTDWEGEETIFCERERRHKEVRPLISNVTLPCKRELITTKLIMGSNKKGFEKEVGVQKVFFCLVSHRMQKFNFAASYPRNNMVREATFVGRKIGFRVVNNRTTHFFCSIRIRQLAWIQYF